MTIVYVLLFITALLLLEGISSFFADQRSRNRHLTRRRLQELAGHIKSPKVVHEESILRKQKKATPFSESIPGRKELRRLLYQAGLTIPPETFVVLSIGLTLGGFLLGMLFLVDIPMALMCSSAGLLPWMRMARMRAVRRRAFEQQFPDALDLLIRALRAGHSLTSGFAMVGKEMPDPIGAEFAQVSDEVQLGQALRTALDNLAYRVDSPDLPFFVTAITIQQETGSNLAEVLENLSSVMRDRFQLLGKVRALTATGRASANLLAAWPIVTVSLLYMANPDYVKPLWEEEAGHTMMFISAVMVAIGYVVCRRMATIKV